MVLRDALLAVGLRQAAYARAAAAAAASTTGQKYATVALREDKTLPAERIAQALALSSGRPWLPARDAVDIDIGKARELDIRESRDLRISEPGRFTPIGFDGQTVLMALARPDEENAARTRLAAINEKLRMKSCITTPSALESLHYRNFENTAARFDEAAKNKDISGMLSALLVHACYLGGVENIYLEPGPSVGHVTLGVEGVRRHFRALAIDRDESRDMGAAQIDGPYGRIINIIRNDMKAGDIEIRAQGSLNDEIPPELRGRFDFRVELMKTVYGLKAVIRPYDRHAEAMDFDQLGFDADTARKLKSYVEAPYGLFVVAGPTSSGKNTTLASMLFVTDSVSRSVQTVENPAELRVGAWAQHEIPGSKSGSESEAKLQYEIVRGLLRSAPHVIYFGEIRDGDALNLAVTRVARTGHLTLTTFHDVSAAGTCATMLDLRTSNGEKLRPDAFASVLLGVMSQRLMRRVCPSCAVPDDRDETRKEVEKLHITEESATHLRRAREGGCPMCAHTGYRGRTLVYELLHATEEVREAITEEKTVRELRKYVKPSLWECGMERVAYGITTLDELKRVIREDVA